MSENSDLTMFDKIAYLVENIKGAKTNTKLLILAYWQVFDDIFIPDEVLQQILGKATNPETITRMKRAVLSSPTLPVEDIQEQMTAAVEETMLKIKEE